MYQFRLEDRAAFCIHNARMKWEIVHQTCYTYAAPVKNSFNEARLQPFSNDQQTVEQFEINVVPAARLRHYHDLYSNIVHHFEIIEPHSSLLVESKVRVTTHPPAFLPEDAVLWPLSRMGEALRDTRTYEFVDESRYIELSPEAWRIAVDATIDRVDTWQAALALMRFVNQHLEYLPNSTNVHTHMRRVLAERRGVCQDFAHVMIGLCRAVKIPALYVSGYLATEKTSATHAWMEVFVPGLGWRALDPTHNCQAGENYVKIAIGRDYADVPPLTGFYQGTTDRTMEVDVKVLPLR
jgi:transglutaminase-like putative cysteine protease